MYLNEDCAISDGVATCTIIAGVEGVTTTDTEIETVVPFTVQGGGSGATPTSAPSAGSGASGGGASQTSTPASTPSSGSGATGGTSNTAASTGSSSSGAPAPTQSDNGVGKVQSGIAASAFAVGMTLIGLLVL